MDDWRWDIEDWKIWKQQQWYFYKKIWEENYLQDIAINLWIYNVMNAKWKCETDTRQTMIKGISNRRELDKWQIKEKEFLVEKQEGCSEFGRTNLFLTRKLLDLMGKYKPNFLGIYIYLWKKKYEQTNQKKMCKWKKD